MKQILTILIQNTIAGLAKAMQKPGELLCEATGNTSGILSGYTSAKWPPSGLSVNSQWTPSELSSDPEPTGSEPPVCGVCWPVNISLFFSNRAGRFHYSSIKLKKMATTVSSQGINPDRIKTDPRFERTRENNAEFRRAGKAAKFLRVVFRELTILAKDKETHARLVQSFLRVISTDNVGNRGERTVNKGDIVGMQGFNFNERAGFRDLFYRHYKVNFDRVTGQVTVNIPDYVPKTMVEAPLGSTHYRLILAAAAVDIDQEKYEYVSHATPELDWNHVPVAANTMSVALPANSTQAVLVTLGIEFYQHLNERYYILKTGEHNASTIVLVDPAP